jgi:hypothetical protein
MVRLNLGGIWADPDQLQGTIDQEIYARGWITPGLLRMAEFSDFEWYVDTVDTVLGKENRRMSQGYSLR